MIKIQCNQHPEKPAVAVCLGCHKGLCEDCRQIYQGKSLCKECLITLNKRENPQTVDEFISNVEKEFSQVQNKVNNFIKERKIDEEMNKFKNEANVLVDDISTKLTDFKLTRSKDYGYLVCEDCFGYYKLEKGESPEDFESCECGGALKFKKKLEIS